MTPDELAKARHAAIRNRLSPADPEAALVWDYLAELCHVTATSFADNPQRTSFNEGKRAVFLHLAGLVNLPLTPE